MVNVSDNANELTTLNLKIADAEMSREDGFLEKVLADDLIFRRADASVATKEQYLAGIRNPENTYSQLEASNVEALVHGDGLAPSRSWSALQAFVEASRSAVRFGTRESSSRTLPAGNASSGSTRVKAKQDENGRT